MYIAIYAATQQLRSPETFQTQRTEYLLPMTILGLLSFVIGTTYIFRCQIISHVREMYDNNELEISTDLCVFYALTILIRSGDACLIQVIKNGHNDQELSGPDLNLNFK